MTSDAATSFWIVGPRRGELRRAPLPPLAPGWVRVRARFSGVSRGTERLVLRGETPPSQAQAMRCPFQEGSFPFPVKYGYAAVGVVEAGDAELLGRVVFALHPHQSVFDVPVEAATPVPEAVPAGRAVLAANMETALNAAWDAGLYPGARVCVVGAGVVGLLTARLAARTPGCAVLVHDVDAGKRETALALGASFSAEPPPPGGFDLVLHASGAPAGLRTALAVAGDEGEVVELSWFGDRAVELPLGEDFHAKRLTIRSSQVGRVAPRQRPRWPHRRRLALALELLADPVLDRLLGPDAPFADLPDAMAAIADGEAGFGPRVVYEP